jgi:uncharacterized integral membrane protein
MRAIIWALRLILFFLLFGFAVKNDDVVVLRFFFGAAWNLPLVLVVMLFFMTGALLGAVGALTSLMRQQREITRLQATIDQLTVRDALPVRRSPAAAAMQPAPATPPVVHVPDLPENY